MKHTPFHKLYVPILVLGAFSSEAYTGASIPNSGDSDISIPWGSEPDCDTLKFITTSQLKALKNRVEALANLKSNWDGYGGSPVSRAVIDNSIAVINAIPGI